MPKRGWDLPEREATPAEVFINRRKFLRTAALLGASATSGCGEDRVFTPFEETQQPSGTVSERSDTSGRYPAETNPTFAALDRAITDEEVAATYNNFYEFNLGKSVFRYVGDFEPLPWTVSVSGLVEKPKVYDVDELISSMQLEERLYRHRCVEAWSMAVPWTGFAMKSLVDMVRPLSSARFVKMTSFFDTAVAPGQWQNPQFPWAYTEGLTIDEATNELTMLVTGAYGRALPKQHGAPIRLVVPWKYGFKGIKSIVSIEFIDRQPATFWNTEAPHEYGFESNVDPQIPHPRWSQSTERFIVDSIYITDEKPTLLYNGYGEWVSHLNG